MNKRKYEIQELDTIEELQKEYGGYLGEHPDYPETEWKNDVLKHNTRLGYWEWVYIEMYGA